MTSLNSNYFIDIYFWHLSSFIYSDISSVILDSPINGSILWALEELCACYLLTDRLQTHYSLYKTKNSIFSRCFITYILYHDKKKNRFILHCNLFTVFLVTFLTMYNNYLSWQTTFSFENIKQYKKSQLIFLYIHR